MCRNLSGNTAENDGNTKKYALKISQRFVPPSRWNLSKFVVIKHFG